MCFFFKYIFFVLMSPSQTLRSLSITDLYRFVVWDVVVVVVRLKEFSTFLLCVFMVFCFDICLYILELCGAVWMYAVVAILSYSYLLLVVW